MIWFALAVCMYPLLLMVSMVGAVGGRFTNAEAVATIAYVSFNAMACMGPAVFVCNVVLLVMAPIASRYARETLWLRWTVAACISAALWSSLFVLTLFLMPVLAI